MRIAVRAAAGIPAILRRLSFLAVLALVACSRSPLTYRDFIVETHEQGEWEVSKAQAAEAKLALLAYLVTAHPAHGEAVEYFEKERPAVNAKIGKFYLQYIGGYLDPTQPGWSEAGDKAIRISGLCEMLPEFTRETMHKQEVGISDGGSCVIQAGYSLAQRKIVNFTVGFKV